MEEAKFQIGKQGVTQGVIDSLKLSFKNYKQVRISALKSSGRDRTSINSMAEELSRGLEDEKYQYVYKIIGFTIIMRKKSKK